MMTRMTLTLLASLAAATLPVAAAEQPAPKALVAGDPFPRLEAEFLTGRKAVLPDEAKGKVAVVLMGFTYDSRFSVEKWVERFRADVKAGPDVTWFEVPVIGGLGRMASWFINSGMRRGTPKELHENVITVYGGVDRWKTVMGFSEQAPNDAYLAVLDREGRAQWVQHHGVVTEADLSELTAVVERLTRSGR